MADRLTEIEFRNAEVKTSLRLEYYGDGTLVLVLGDEAEGCDLGCFELEGVEIIKLKNFLESL